MYGRINKKQKCNFNSRTIRTTTVRLYTFVKASVFSSMIDEMKIDNQIQAINYIEEIDAFFKQCSKNDSKHTARQYRNGLTKLEAYTEENNINIFATLPVSRREGTQSETVNITHIARGKIYQGA